MRIRIQLPKIMRIWIRNPLNPGNPTTWFFSKFYIYAQTGNFSSLVRNSTWRVLYVPTWDCCLSHSSLVMGANRFLSSCSLSSFGWISFFALVAGPGFSGGSGPYWGEPSHKIFARYGYSLRQARFYLTYKSRSQLQKLKVSIPGPLVLK